MTRLGSTPAGSHFEGIILGIPPLTEIGDLPLGVHPASLREVMVRFAVGSAQRIAVGLRLERVYAVARATRDLRRFVVFGSFVTAKEEPNDVDVFFILENRFDPALLTREAQSLFDHTTAQAQFGASVFWFRQLGCLEGEQTAVEYWQVKRGGGLRGIIEVIGENP